MKAWILHHHLLTGGVTSVIHTQAQAFDNIGQNYEVVVGDPAERQPGGKKPQIIDSLAYLPKDLGKGALDNTYKKLKEGLTPLAKEGVLHVHNLNLGKNPVLNLVIADLLAEGAKVVNHCHDFAEDHRPLNIEHLHQVIVETYRRDLEETLYPKGRALVYIVINKADRQRLLQHEVRDQNIVDAPNAIAPPPPCPVGARKRIQNDLSLTDKTLVLYPVRAIQRKNIPELLLLSSLFLDEAQFAITQPAKNPVEVEALQPWVTLSGNLNLPVVFEAGLKADFHDLMSGCDLVVSTSTNEGFGLGFLEPWLHGKSVIGRNLPQVTSDFQEQGIEFPQLYDQLKIDGIDFPALSSEKQRDVLIKSLKNPSFAKSIREQNQLNSFLSPPNPKLIQANAQKVLVHYSVENYGHRLSQIYATSF